MSTEEKTTETRETTTPTKHRLKLDKKHIQGFIAGIIVAAIVFTSLYYGTNGGRFSSGDMSENGIYVTVNGQKKTLNDFANGISETPVAEKIPAPMGWNLFTYVIEDGDTLEGLAERFNTTVENILYANYTTREMMDELFEPGEMILIITYIESVY